MQPATVTPGVISTAIQAGPVSGEYRYATDSPSAADAIAWVLDTASGSLLGPGQSLGIDFETTSLKPSDGRIRLVQIASGDRCVVIDAFALDPWPLLVDITLRADPLWIAHNAYFEQSWMAHHASLTLLPIFDTRWVHVDLRTTLTNEWSPTSSSLQTVCLDQLGLELSKEQRLSDWSADTLSVAQLEYAALDSLVLIPLRERFERSAIENDWLPQLKASLGRSETEARNLAPVLARR